MYKNLSIIILIFIMLDSSQADIIQVPQEYPTIQEGIDAAVDFDTVLVGPGVYNEAIDYKRKSLVLLSSQGPLQTYIDGTGIIGDIIKITNISVGEPALTGFSIINSSSSNVLYISNSVSSLVSHNMFYSNYLPEQFHGIILCPTDINLSRNLFYNNSGNGPVSFILSDYQGYTAFINNNTFADSLNVGYVSGSVNNIIYSSNNENDNHGNLYGQNVFSDTILRDYSLVAGSPAIDAGDEDSIYNDLDGTRNDKGAFPYLTIFDFIDLIHIDSKTLVENITNHFPQYSWKYQHEICFYLQTQFELAIGTDNNWSYAEMWNPAPFDSRDTFVTYSGAELNDGEDYYGRLRVSNGIAWSDWEEFSFRMNSKPSTPGLLYPPNNTVIESDTVLYWSSSFDQEDDDLSYNIIVTDEENIIVEESIGVSGLSSPLSFQINGSYIENEKYNWTVRSYDGYEFSDWSDTLSFWVNDLPEHPLEASLIYPIESNSPTNKLSPTFNWIGSTDPDPLDTVFYRLTLASDSLFVFLTVIDSITDTFYTVEYPLDFDDSYWWKVESIDKYGLVSTSTVHKFTTFCCTNNYRGNINNDYQDLLDISDLLYLVDYFFKNPPGPSPHCLQEADVNASGYLDISDLLYLVDYFFLTPPGPSPKSCESVL